MRAADRVGPAETGRSGAAQGGRPDHQRPDVHGRLVGDRRRRPVRHHGSVRAGVRGGAAEPDRSCRMAGQAPMRRPWLAAYRATRLVARRAQTVDPQSWTGSFAVRDLREQLGEMSGDVDRYVAVLAEHPTSAVQYERISLALLEAGRRQEAIEWARRALADRPGWPHTDRLRDALVDMLLDEGDTEAAMVVRRTEFERHPSGPAPFARRVRKLGRGL